MRRGYGGFGGGFVSGGFVSGPAFAGPVFGGPMVYGGGYGVVVDGWVSTTDDTDFIATGLVTWLVYPCCLQID